MLAWLQKTIETFQFGDDEIAYVAIKSMVEKLGLDWPRERAILEAEDHWGFRESVINGVDGAFMIAGLPAAKVFIWLKTVDIEQVRPELRQPLAEYQEESRRITRESFLRSDLLKYARAKDPAERSPIEQKLVEAATLLEKG
jgi:P22_AR N-terminal domain